MMFNKLILLILLLSYQYSLAIEPIKLARFQLIGSANTQYGQIKNGLIYPLKGTFYKEQIIDGPGIPLDKVKLLVPTKPSRVFAVGMNYSSHLSSNPEQAPPLFLKLPSSLIASKEKVYLPADASNAHFEGELVIVIGKAGKNISMINAKQHILGVTIGNDISERNWQSNDLQWLRAKASDGFGPIATSILSGVDYNNLRLQTHLNGRLVQDENTQNMIHKPAKVIAYLSRYFHLQPGDLIFMGTPDSTQAMSDKDKVRISLSQEPSPTEPNTSLRELFYLENQIFISQ